MEKVEFIRHFFQGERIVSPNSDILWPKPDSGEFYQDVLVCSSMEDGIYTVYTAGKHLFPKANDMTVSMQRWMVMFIVGGTIYCGSQAFETGDFIVLPPSCPQEFMTKADNVKFYWFTTGDPSHVGVMMRRGYMEREMMIGRIEGIHTLADMFENLIYKMPPQCDAQSYTVGSIGCMISFITSPSVKKQKASDQILRRCLSIIDGKLGVITVDKLAKTCFVSRRYLYKLFKEYKDISPVEYILSVRMMFADRFLTNTDFSISKVAELMGYSNYSHFTRAYTKYFSTSPSNRRKQIKKTAYMNDTAEVGNAHTLEG